MTIRVTSAEVKRIVNTAISNELVDEHIGVASRLVDELFGTSTLSTGRLRDIELYLAAHFTSLYDIEAGMTTEQEVGQARNKYDYQQHLGSNLGLTRYGITAIALDTTNTLVNVGGKKRAMFRTYGTSDC